MSIYALHGLLTSRVCRQTLLWTTMFRSIRPNPIAVVIRDAHNSLYQMVKKRTLEARTKLQATKFPNNQACAAQGEATPGFAQNQSTTGRTNTKSLNINKISATMKAPGVSIPATPINRIKPNYPSCPGAGPSPSKKTAKNTRSTTTDDNDKPYRNVEVLRARDCNFSIEDEEISAGPVKSKNSAVSWAVTTDKCDTGTYNSAKSVSGCDSSSSADNETTTGSASVYSRNSNATGRGATTRSEIFPTNNVTGRGAGGVGAAVGSRGNSASVGSRASGASVGGRATVASSSGRSTAAAVSGRTNVTTVGSRSGDAFVRDNLNVSADCSVGRATVDELLVGNKTNAASRGIAASNYTRAVSQGKDPCAKDVTSGYGSAGNKSKSMSVNDNDDQYCDDDGGDEKKDRMMLYAMLAAMGAGGLLWWMLCGKKCKEPAVVVKDNKACDGFKTIPASSADLPKQVPYLLIGGGTAAFSAFRAIKSNDPKAKVLMITDEMKKPYMRPPLSKELWYSAPHGKGMPPDLRFKQWTGAERSLFFEPEEFFVDPKGLLSKPNGGIAVAQGFKVRKVNPEKRIVTLDDGYEIAYDECLIATGCKPKNLSIFDDAPNSVKDKVMVYRTPEDFECLKKYADENKTIAIIGNGFTGSELACSLANYTKGTQARIYQIFPEVGNMSRVLPQYLSKWTTKKVESAGVLIINKATVKEAARDDSKLKLTLSNGKTLLVDVAVVCVGCEPNTELAGTSGLEVSKRLGGFVVNSELEARRNLYVAGDASCFYDPLLGRRRVEHHDHSVVSGRLAGENMTGKNNSYTHQSMFWSDLGPEIGYEGIGLVDASLPTVGVFALQSKTDSRTDNLTEDRKENLTELKIYNEKPPVTCDADEENYGRGVIFYLKDNKIVGILLWNLFNRIGLARTIITQNKQYDDLNEVAKLFEIHS